MTASYRSGSFHRFLRMQDFVSRMQQGTGVILEHQQDRASVHLYLGSSLQELHWEFSNGETGYVPLIDIIGVEMQQQPTASQQPPPLILMTEYVKLALYAQTWREYDLWFNGISFLAGNCPQIDDSDGGPPLVGFGNLEEERLTEDSKAINSTSSDFEGDSLDGRDSESDEESEASSDLEAIRQKLQYNSSSSSSQASGQQSTEASEPSECSDSAISAGAKPSNTSPLLQAADAGVGQLRPWQRDGTGQDSSEATENSVQAEQMLNDTEKFRGNLLTVSESDWEVYEAVDRALESNDKEKIEQARRLLAVRNQLKEAEAALAAFSQGDDDDDDSADVQKVRTAANGLSRDVGSVHDESESADSKMSMGREYDDWTSVTSAEDVPVVSQSYDESESVQSGTESEESAEMLDSARPIFAPPSSLVTPDDTSSSISQGDASASESDSGELVSEWEKLTTYMDLISGRMHDLKSKLDSKTSKSSLLKQRQRELNMVRKDNARLAKQLEMLNSAGISSEQGCMSPAESKELRRLKKEVKTLKTVIKECQKDSEARQSKMQELESLLESRQKNDNNPTNSLNSYNLSDL